MFEEADLIHHYSRPDALRDGVLIDVSATAREHRVSVPPGVVCQDEAGRFWRSDTRLTPAGRVFGG